MAKSVPQRKLTAGLFRVMRVSVRFRRLLPFLVTLGIAPFLPIYARCTMVRSQVMGHAGDVIDYRWHASSLVAFGADFAHMSAEEHAGPLLLANLLLALGLAAGVGLGFRRFWPASDP